MRETKVKKKEEKAITLIALVITIIVLLILAGISIMTLTGDNGILKRATEAQEKTEEAKREEQEQLEQIDKYVNEYLNSQEKIQIVNFGDSIFGNYRSEYGSEESISALISEMTGKRCLNAGFGGCNMCQRDDLYGAFSMVSLSDSMVNNDWSAQKKAISDAKLSSEYSDSELANGYFLETVEMLEKLDWNNVDIITIAYGTNDFSANYDYGFSDGAVEKKYDKSYYGDALAYSIERIKSKYPNIQIFIVTPMYRWFLENSDFSSDCTTKKNSKNALLKDYVETCQLVTSELNVELIDNYNELGIDSSNYYNYFNDYDGTHPTIDGRILVAENIASHITGIEKNYSKKYVYLKTEPYRHTSKFFGNLEIPNQKILSLNIITNSVSKPIENPDYSWPVSITNNNSIMMYVYEDDTETGYYNAYMCSNSEIYTPVNASYIFSDLENIKSLDLTGINFQYSNNMDYMFFNCGKSKNMTNLNLGNNFDTSRVYTMKYMFASCGYDSNMTDLNLKSKFITRNVKDMTGMFASCGYGAITNLNLGALTIPEGTITTNFLSSGTGKPGCKVIVSNSKLKSLIEGLWNVGTVEIIK